jgi:hypothetical protein
VDDMLSFFENDWKVHVCRFPFFSTALPWLH